LRPSFGIGSGNLTVGPDGRMVTAPREIYGQVIAFDAQGKSLGWELTIGRRDGEIGAVSRMGWTGNTLWAGDGWFRQAAFLDAKGKVTKSIPHPSWVHPHWSERRKYPLYGSMQVIALNADSSMLVQPSSPRAVLE